MSVRVFSAVLLVLPTLGLAKSQINNSEESAVSICEAFDRDYQELIEFCSIAVDDPGLTQALRLKLQANMAEALYFGDENDRAEEIYREILETNAKPAKALRGLGWIRYDEGQYEDAVPLFQQSVDFEPSASALVGHGAEWPPRAPPLAGAAL